MNCADRLVQIFGSQAEVARQFRLDRAVVNHWVKAGYVPARWAMEVEQATRGQVAAADILREATARKPLRMKSRPDGESLFGSPLKENDAMNDFAPARRINSFHPPQRTLLGPGPSDGGSERVRRRLRLNGVAQLPECDREVAAWEMMIDSVRRGRTVR